MSHSSSGHIHKHERILRAMSKAELTDYQRTLFFHKGEHRGVLSVYANAIVWEVYKDLQCSQHLDWNHPDCNCLGTGDKKMGLLEIMSRLNECGFEFEYDTAERNNPEEGNDENDE